VYFAAERVKHADVARRVGEQVDPVGTEPEIQGCAFCALAARIAVCTSEVRPPAGCAYRSSHDSQDPVVEKTVLVDGPQKARILSHFAGPYQYTCSALG